MKKLLVGILLSLVTVLAFALPSPRQIEDALANGRYGEAQSMVSQVLSERPDSARAHLLNAYLLAHVNHDKTGANAELNTAAGLDKNGDVKNSPLFGRVVGEIDAQPAAPPVRQKTYQPTPVVQQPAVSPVYQPEHQKSSGHGLLIFVLFCGTVGVGILVYLFIRGADERRRIREVPYTPYTTSGSRQLTQTRSGGTYTAPYNPPPVPLDPYPSMPVYHQPAPVVVQQAPQQSFGSQVAATATGVVAGELIHDALVGSNRRSQSWGEEPRREREVYREPVRETYRDPEPVRESPVSYSNERASFNSGRDDSWSPPAAPSRSDDWSSTTTSTNDSWTSDPAPTNDW